MSLPPILAAAVPIGSAALVVTVLTGAASLLADGLARRTARRVPVPAPPPDRRPSTPATSGPRCLR